MIHRLILCCIVLSATFTSGCFFSKKNRKPKENPAIAGEVEETFKRRWVDQRANQLAAQGVASGAARAQAIREFEAKFEFNQPPKK